MMRKNETPECLARDASRGNEESFVALCDHMKTKLFRAAKGVLGDETLALDAVSEAVFRAFKGIKRLREPKHAETWFVRILLNVANDMRRRRKHEILTEAPPEAPHYDRHDELEFAQMIESLPPDLREVVSLKYFSGYTLREIAEILRVPEGTAKSRLSRALRSLRLLHMEDMDG